MIGATLIKQGVAFSWPGFCAKSRRCAVQKPYFV